MTKLVFPSPEFEEVVAAVCHGTVSDEQARRLNELLRSNAAARDEYIMRVELHSRLGTDPDLFAATSEKSESPENVVGLPTRQNAKPRATKWAFALAACVTLLAIAWFASRFSHLNSGRGTTSKAIAMLNRVADAQWNSGSETPRSGAPLEPGVLRLRSGLAQIVFYSGARVVIEGPVELQLISSTEVSCRSGKLTAEVPPQARGFRVNTPQMKVTDLGTSFGLDVKERLTELHVFKGSVELQPSVGTKQNLKEGAGAVADNAAPPKFIIANPAAFASLFELQLKSSDAAVLRHEQWRAASHRLDEDPSLLVHFDFDASDATEWRLVNTSKLPGAVPDATIIGCKRIEGRWPDKRALEFGGVSDRVRLSVPGDYESLTLAAWVRVQGLDRRVNSLFMSDAFEPGTLHWLVLNDGAPTVTVVGPPGRPVQIVTGPPVMTLDKFGMWQHIAVVVDGRSDKVVHYLNGRAVSDAPLRIKPPFRIGAAELGNWNAKGFKGDESLMIRNFSGAMDEFCLFSRALGPDEIRALYSQGKPQPEPMASRE